MGPRMPRTGWLVLACGLLGCATMNSPATKAPPDPVVEEIANQPTVDRHPGWSTLKADVVLREVPLKTPVGDAQTIMEKHGFSCWSGVSEGDAVYLKCIAYHRKQPTAPRDRIVVKLYYANRRVENVNVTIEYGADKSNQGLLSGF